MQTEFASVAEEVREEPYAKFLRSQEWRDTVARVLKRDGGLCQCCLARSAVQVHHLGSYRAGRRPPAFMLISVCKVCHSRFHASKLGRRDEWEKIGRSF
jgi:5-methylcytosine-specific restriction endonuclease McrA